MIRKTLALLIPAILMIGMVGCGDDGPTVSVNPVLKFTTGDKFTYNYYDRDSTNSPIEDSKQVLVWTVLRTNLDTLGENAVVEIEEVRSDNTGQEVGRSKIYFAIDQGELSQYDFFHTILNRFGGTVDLSVYLSGVSPVWIKVNSTKDANARVLQSNDNFINQTLTDVTVPLPLGEPIVFDAKLKLGIFSQHLGKTSVTVPLNTYSSAYSTDNNMIVTITNIDAINTVVGQIPANSTLVSDTALVHYDVDINGGILRQTLDSKTIYLAKATVGTIFPIAINGFEMELVASERVSTE